MHVNTVFSFVSSARLCSVPGGFQGCHMAVHEGDVLTQPGWMPMRLIVIEQERSRAGRKRENEVGNPTGRIAAFQEKEGRISAGLINWAAIQFSIPFVT